MPRHRREYVASPGGTMRNKSTGQRKGVTKVGKRFKATAWDAEQGKRRYIGMYDNSPDAAAAAVEAEQLGADCLPSPRPYHRKPLRTLRAPLAPYTAPAPTTRPDLTSFYFMCACGVRVLCGRTDQALRVGQPAAATLGAALHGVRSDVRRRGLRRHQSVPAGRGRCEGKATRCEAWAWRRVLRAWRALRGRGDAPRGRGDAC